VLLIAAVIFYIDLIASEAIERGGTAALGLETRVGRVRLGLLSTELSLSDMTVANPEGFEAPHLLKLEKGELEVGLSELRADPIVISRIVLSGIELNLEKDRGRTNFGVLLENLSRSEADASASKAEGEAGAGLVIGEVLIRDVTARGQLIPLQGERTQLEVNVPEIRMRDLGSGESGMSMTQLAGVLTKAILAGVAQKSASLRTVGGSAPQSRAAGKGAGGGARGSHEHSGSQRPER
jgi:uncharacterized protein involved in outer membrane biogenesis